jgi:hypothetical protein
VLNGNPINDFSLNAVIHENFQPNRMFGKFEVIASDDVLLNSVLQHGRISWNTRWGNLDEIKVEIVHEGSNTDAVAALNTEWIQGISDSDSEEYDSAIPQWGRLRRLDDDQSLQYRYLRYQICSACLR